MKHSLERTSPKGPGQKFIGTCTQCGRKGLTMRNFYVEECDNPRGVTEDQGLLEAINHPMAEKGEDE